MNSFPISKIKPVEDVIQFLIPDKEKRKNYLSILFEIIKEADTYGKNKWGVHCRENRIRLLIGNIIVFTIEKECIWLALDKNLSDSSADMLSSLEKFGHWKWDREDYPVYKQVPSKNGYYTLSDYDSWLKIRPLHLEFVRKVAAKYRQLNIRSQIYHSPEFIYYIRKELNLFVPVPVYKKNDTESVFPEEICGDEEYYEGAIQKVTVNIYERSPEARQKCIEHYGTNCRVCGFNFENSYGEIGKGFIHVHHLKPLSEIGEEYELNPIQDLCPVCPNCHAMLHKRKPPYSIEELQRLIKPNPSFKQTTIAAD